MTYWKELRWLNAFGWWPLYEKNPKIRKLYRYYGYALFISDFIQVGPEYIALFVRMREGSFRKTILNLNTTLAGTTCAIKLLHLFHQENRIANIIDEIDELEDRGSSEIGDKIEHIKKPIERRKSITWNIVQTFVVFSLHWLVTPILMGLQGVKRPIIDSWTPWTQETWSGWALTLGFQSVHVFTAIVGLFMTNCLYISILESILLNFNILHQMLLDLDFEKNTSKFGDYITYHQNLLRVTKEVNNIFGRVQQMQCITVIAISCFSVIEINENTPVNRLLNLIELVSSVLFFFLLDCYLSQSVSEASSNVARCAYQNNWYLASFKDRKALKLMHERSKKPQMFGGFIIIELNTFITVIKSAFSYYNFLKAIDMKT
ncbi:odorant receptor 85c-like [Cimex lectularius]|uniref:Odorant receptor n=1 Tax=Cimex lectularius TaxID=79782 RepID=A0A8I6S1W4_CIMLE|nr:odorant receptor 85c-like [Cimex lectularius]